MGNIKEAIKSTSLFNRFVKNSGLYHAYSDWRRTQSELSEVKGYFASERPPHGNWEDYRRAYKKHRVSYLEYMHQFRFWELTEEERDEFVTYTRMRMLYNAIVTESVRRLFLNKAEFLRRFAPFIHRRWLVAEESTPEQFGDLLSATDCIAKPLEGSYGKNIFKIEQCTSKERIPALYARCRHEHLLIEEYIRNIGEIRAFHPQSLNTIRVYTVNSLEGIKVLESHIRMGRGEAVVDNIRAGGIFAVINLQSGIVESDGFTNRGEVYTHSDTGAKIKGFAVPRWNDILNTCREAARLCPEVIVTGWDVIENSSHQIEIVEGNGTPDVTEIQTALKTGLKGKVKELLAGKVDDCLLALL